MIKVNDKRFFTCALGKTHFGRIIMIDAGQALFEACNGELFHNGDVDGLSSTSIPLEDVGGLLNDPEDWSRPVHLA